MMQSIFQFTFIFLALSHSTAQNLIDDASFENQPRNLMEMKGIATVMLNESDNILNAFSVDYFNTSFNGTTHEKAGIPTNMFGNVCARTGSAYIGLNLIGIEALTLRLTEPMKTGRSYCVSLYVAKGHRALDQTLIQLLITDSLIDFKPLYRKYSATTYRKNTYNPELISALSGFVELKTEDAGGANWNLVCGVYKAHGGEQFLNIKNFRSSEAMEPFLEKRQEWNASKERNPNYVGGSSYYYVDDVSVKERGLENPCNCTENKSSIYYTTKIPCVEVAKNEGEVRLAEKSINSLETNKNYTLANILFGNGSHRISRQGSIELDTLAAQMHRNLEIFIKVVGHTDWTGDSIRNQNLSLQRANSIRNYLSGKGIPDSRIQTFGRGTSAPIASNHTEAGRIRNRRVELIVME
jgi:outer membrane protein OmpA-like peptidoglycan-associated protein